MKSLYYVAFLLLFTIHTKENTKLKNLKTSFIQIDQEEDTYTFGKLDKCTPDICINGKCISETVCECKPDFASTEKDIACTYPRKLQLVAFLLELICPFGSSHLYLESHKIGIFKFCFIIVYPLILLIIFCHCVSNTHHEGAKRVQNVLGYIFCGSYVVGFIAWYIYDLFMLGLHPMKDGNSISLIKWG
jgi:hypothetical protein